MTSAPEVWWSPSLGEVLLPGLPNDPLSCSVYRDGWDTIERPADAVPLVPAEPVDEKSRGEAYMRGHRDGRLAERAGIGREETLVSGSIYVGPLEPRPDLPPFAPELADAPLPTGESGAAAPLVVDQPVHDSTLPAELHRGPLRDFPSDGPEDEGTHYSGDGCQPPHPDPTAGAGESPPGKMLVEFDSGPLHEADLLVQPDRRGDLPTVVVTDEGDFWMAYVLVDADGRTRRYQYAGSATDEERRRCPYVSGNNLPEGKRP